MRAGVPASGQVPLHSPECLEDLEAGIRGQSWREIKAYRFGRRLVADSRDPWLSLLGDKAP